MAQIPRLSYNNFGGGFFMKKKPLFMSESMVLMSILLVFILAAGGIYLSVQNYVPPEPKPASAANFGREEAYLEIARQIREEKDELLQIMALAEPLEDSIRYEDAVHLNPELAGLMQAHGIERIYREPQMWSLHTSFSGGIVTASVYYDILYTQADPRGLVTAWNKDSPWIRTGKGWMQADGNTAYLEEISDDFYYFYLAT